MLCLTRSHCRRECGTGDTESVWPIIDSTPEPEPRITSEFLPTDFESAYEYALHTMVKDRYDAENFAKSWATRSAADFESFKKWYGHAQKELLKDRYDAEKFAYDMIQDIKR